MEEISLSVISFLHKLQLICLHAIITNVSTHLNGFNYYYLTLIIPYNFNHCIFTQLSRYKYFYLTIFIPFNITH